MEEKIKQILRQYLPPLSIEQMDQVVAELMSLNISSSNADISDILRIVASSFTSNPKIQLLSKDGFGHTIENAGRALIITLKEVGVRGTYPFVVQIKSEKSGRGMFTFDLDGGEIFFTRPDGTTKSF